MKRILIVALFVLCLWPSVAAAHALVIESSIVDGAVLDVAPAEVVLRFSEPLDKGYSSLTLYNEQSQPIGLPQTQFPAADSMQVALPAELRPGEYTLIYKVLSTADGHRSAGSLLFSIGTGVAPTAPSVEVSATADASLNWGVVSGRSIALTGGLGAIGGLAWLLILLLPAIQHNPESRLPLLVRPTIWLTQLSLVLLLIGSVWEFVVRASDFGDGSLASIQYADVLSSMAISRWGVLALIRLVAITLLIPLTFLAAYQKPMGYTALALASLSLLTFSMSGHAAANIDDPITPVASDWMHMLTAAVWFGGLIGMALSAWVLRKTEAALRNSALAWLIARFSPLALFSIAMVVLTGTMRTFDQLPTLAGLWESRYGQTLLIKLAVMLAALLLGFWHWRKLNPRLQAAKDQTTVVKIGLTLGLESALAIGVILVASALTQTPHPVKAAPSAGGTALPTLPTPTPRVSQPLYLTAQREDLTMTLDTDDNRPGERQFSATVRDANGVIRPDRVRLRFESLDLEAGQQVAILEPAADGRFTATSGALSLVGRWKIEMQVRRLNLPDVTAEWTVEITR